MVQVHTIPDANRLAPDPHAAGDALDALPHHYETIRTAILHQGLCCHQHQIVGKNYHGSSRTPGLFRGDEHAAYMSADPIQLEFFDTEWALRESERRICSIWHHEFSNRCGSHHDAHSKSVGAQDAILSESFFTSNVCCWLSVSVS